jgi:hypothetical protein
MEVVEAVDLLFLPYHTHRVKSNNNTNHQPVKYSAPPVFIVEARINAKRVVLSIKI